jgi:hypothetical protein
MKSYSLFYLLLLSYGLVSCDKKEASSSTAASRSEEKEAPIPIKFQSKKLPPGSQEHYDRSVKAGGSPSIAHDIPPLHREARGVYSTLGAAKEFKALCGFDLPGWVEPLKGNFNISMRKSGAVRQSILEYKIDPTRRAELEKRIAEANAREFPQRYPVIFVQSSSQPGARVGSIGVIPNGKVKESMAVRIEEGGTVVLIASRGPVGWDD